MSKLSKRQELEREARDLLTSCDKDEIIDLYVQDMSDDELEKWVYYNKYEDE